MVPFALLFWVSSSLDMPVLVAAAIAAVIAALISMSLSLLLLSRQREAAAQSVYEWRNRDRTVDDVAEDEMVAGDSSAT